MTTVWYHFDRKRDYEEVMLTWIDEIQNSPTYFPRTGYDPQLFVPELIPVLDAWVMTKGAMELVTTHEGDWLGTTPGEVLLCHGHRAVALILAATGRLGIHHGGTMYGLGTPVPWRLLTKAPARYASPAAIRRQAKVLARWRAR